MRGHQAFRIRGGTLFPMPDYGDVGPFEAEIRTHPFLHCWDCGTRLMYGETATEAPIYACPRCKLIVDVRRVA